MKVNKLISNTKYTRDSCVTSKYHQAQTKFHNSEKEKHLKMSEEF